MTPEQKIELLGSWIRAYSVGGYNHDWYKRPEEEQNEIIPLVRDFFTALGLDFTGRFMEDRYSGYQKLVLKAFKELYGK